MEKLLRWMARNRMAAKIILSLLLCGMYSGLLYLMESPLLAIVIADLALIFLIHVYVDACGQYLLKEPLKELNEYCDPYPLLRELETQLDYGYTEAMMQAVRINYSLALRETGEYQKAWEILRDIHIDKYAGTLPVIKFSYYNNLADILTLLGRCDEAEIWWGKSVQLYRDMKEGKAKRQITHAMQAGAADSLYRKGAYKEAIECLDRLDSTDLRDQVDTAMLYARCCIALGDTGKAREKLEFVTARGNKLFFATEAKRLLDTL